MVGKWTLSAASRVLIIVGALAAIVPVLWVLLASLSTNQRVGSSVVGFLGGFHYTNYAKAFTETEFGTFFLNSVLVSSVGAVLVSSIGAAAGYALCRLRFRGRALVFGLVMVGLVVPVYGYFLQLVNVETAVRLYNTRLGLILAEVAVNLAVPILIMFSFFQQVPRELTEAAEVDGASEFVVFARIAAPLARPAVVLCLVFGFVWIWGDQFLPAVLLVTSGNYTIPVGISSLESTSEYLPTYVTLFAAGIMSTVPMAVVYVYISRHVGDLITGGALRG